MVDGRVEVVVVETIELWTAVVSRRAGRRLVMQLVKGVVAVRIRIVLDKRLFAVQQLLVGTSRMVMATGGRLDNGGGILRRSRLDYRVLLWLRWWVCVKVLAVQELTSAVIADGCLIEQARIEQARIEQGLLKRASRRVVGERVRRLLRLTYCQADCQWQETGEQKHAACI